ncbi:hypothetical protein LS684_10960 [Cytobacillus spongiae]|uniref:hypothetical protein n=1 Tax=Cytobacillus spongiae TaxID=2901381 RepID=UPI001F4013E3|nr:hypothetical protein [Cytobacillus spongiae]UII54215.1 hypothetical protein LS684_10960 [Cytobacillus spongiae]
MTVEAGMKFEISNAVKGYFNSAETMVIIREKGSIVQFSLADGKGHGSMPVQHFQYLLRKENLIPIKNNRMMLTRETEENIG